MNFPPPVWLAKWVSKQITLTFARAAQRITTKAKASSAEVGKTVAVTTTRARGTGFNDIRILI